ncbi:MAG TPA: IS110 family transposase [bacterium]|nr:IS110 family transposase [bacterium]
MPRYIGLDLHKMYVHGCEWTPTAPDRHKARHFRFPNTEAGWASLLNEVDCTCLVALEVTGSAFEAYDRLSPHVGRVLLANARELKRLGSKRHSDRVDAARLAKALAMDLVPAVWVPPLPMREVRRLLHYREGMSRHRRQCISQAKRVFQRHGILLPPHSDIHHAAATYDLSLIPAGDRVILASALRRAADLEAEILTIESAIAARLEMVPEVRNLLTITNVGLIAAATIWASVGDPCRFTDPKQLGRYAGLDPSFVQSGETLCPGRISKNGNTLLRTVLVEVALGLARHDTGALGQFYERKKTKIGPKKAAIALARKVLIVAWRMLLTGEAYRATKPLQLARKYRLLERLAHYVAPCGVAPTPDIPDAHQRFTRLRHARTRVPA